MDISLTEIIFYVADQQRSKNFYAALLEKTPVLDVPGMTEFELNPTCKLGLMPENGIAVILADKTPHPSTGNGIPRCELYVFTSSPDEACQKAVQLGASLVSPATARNWGDTVGYVADPDGHILAFARRTDNQV